MSGRRLALIVLVLLELGALVAARLLVNPAAALPVSEVGTQEVGLVEDMRALELAHDPGDLQSWITIGDFYCSFGLLPQAEYCLAQAAELGTLDEDGLLLRGNILSRLGRIDEARAYFQQVIEGRGDRVSDAWIQLALDALRKNDPRSAEKALHQCSDQPIAQLALARLLMRTDRAADAVTLLDRMLEKNPSSLRAVQMKGWAYEAMGEDRAAREQYELSLRHVQTISMLTPVRQHDEQMHQQYGPGRFLMESGQREQQGDLAGAIAMMEQGIEASKPLMRSHYSMRIAELELDLDHPRKALKHLRLVMLNDGESAEIWELVGLAWKRLGDEGKARRAWLEGTRLRASKSMSSNLYIHKNLSESFAEAGDDESARRHRGLMHYEQGRLAWRKNDLQSAEVFFAKATIDNPQQAASWFYLAETRRARNDREGARVAYRQCLLLNASHGRAQRGLAILDSE
jgi:tetratricopeptide (TPR) repeat protein